MTTEPDACTLPPDQLSRRLAEISDLAGRALLHREPLPGGVRLLFAGDAGTEREVRALVAAEARCCAFLDMELRRTPAGLQLDVTGPDAATSTL